MVQFIYYISSFSLILTARSISAISYPFLHGCFALLELLELTISFMERNGLTDFASGQRSKYAAETEQAKDD
jgi:hypothetical protein